VLMAGDMNATPQNDAYRLVTGFVSDSWSEAGKGLGHTYPSKDNREQLAAVPVGGSLLRIDYVFHSHQLAATGAEVITGGILSDHNGLLVDLWLSQ
jgi:endonuclease/exonuclease/phosphatase (EEP) superfamily protein YafD